MPPTTPIDPTIAVGSATGLLTYEVLQLASAAGWATVKVDPDAVPLFFRWRAAMITCAMGSAVTWAIRDRVLASKLAEWAISAACVAGLGALSVLWARGGLRSAERAG